MGSVESERVLVVSAELVRRLGYFQGFSGEVDRYLGELLSPENASYRPRGDMEHDPRFKQLIPYVIFRHQDQAGRQMVFHYRRGKGQGEKRLHRKRSIGVGGHICVDDHSPGMTLHPYEEGMRRELAEEVIIGAAHAQRLVGLINDDKTEVGQVHLGVVHLVDLETPDIRPREKDLLEAGFAPADELLEQQDDFETWSQICLEALFGACSGPA